MPVADSVNIPFVREKLDEDGRLKPTEIMEGAATRHARRASPLGEALAPEPLPSR